MRARTTALVLSAVLVAYFVALGWRGVLLVRDGHPVAVGLGVGILVLPFLGAWALVRELRFGQATQALARRLEAAGELPEDDAPRAASGRVDRVGVQGWFEQFRADVEHSPQDAGAWFRLGCAYDIAGDRKRARAAMRHAVQLDQHLEARPRSSESGTPERP